MSVNVKKSKSMHIGKSEPSEHYMKDNEGNIYKIEHVNQEKDLGIIFDKNLNFDVYIKSKISIANRNLGLIHKKITYLDQIMFKQSCKALVRPHLEYASVVWNPCLKYKKILIENVQRRATRLFNSLKSKSYLTMRD